MDSECVDCHCGAEDRYGRIIYVRERNLETGQWEPVPICRDCWDKRQANRG